MTQIEEKMDSDPHRKNGGLMGEVGPIGLRVITRFNRFLFFMLLLGLEVFLLFVSFFNGFNLGDLKFILYPITFFLFVASQLLIALIFNIYKRFILVGRAYMLFGIISNAILLGILLPSLLYLIRLSTPSAGIQIYSFHDKIYMLLIIVSLSMSIFLLIEYFVWATHIKKQKLTMTNQFFDKQKRAPLISELFGKTFLNFLIWESVKDLHRNIKS